MSSKRNQRHKACDGKKRYATDPTQCPVPGAPGPLPDAGLQMPVLQGLPRRPHAEEEHPGHEPGTRG